MESNNANNEQNLSNVELIRAVLAQLELEDSRNARNSLVPSTEALMASTERTTQAISKLKDRTDIETAHNLLSQITALEDKLNHLLKCNLDDNLEKGVEKGQDIVQVIVLDINVVAPAPRTFLFLGCLPMPLPSVMQQEVLLMVPNFFRKLMGWKNWKSALATHPAGLAGPNAKAKGFGGENINGQTHPAVTDVFDGFFGRSSKGRKVAPATKPAAPKAKRFDGETGQTAVGGRSLNGKKMVW